MAVLRDYRLGASTPVSAPKLRDYRLGATGAAVVPPTVPVLRDYRLGAAGAAAVIVVPLEPVTVGPGDRAVLVAALADGSAADSWSWSCPTLTLVGSGPWVTVDGPSRMPPGQTHTVTVRATKGGVTSPAQTVAVTVLPQLAWAVSGSGASRVGVGAAVVPVWPEMTTVCDERWEAVVAPGAMGATYGVGHHFVDGETDTSGNGRYRRSVWSVRDEVGGGGSVGTLVCAFATVSGEHRVGKVWLKVDPTASPWRGRRWGRYTLWFRCPDELPGYKAVPMIGWPDDQQGGWERGEVDVAEMHQLSLAGKAWVIHHYQNAGLTQPPPNVQYDTGVRPVADGQWHQVVLQVLPWGVTTWLDGRPAPRTFANIPPRVRFKIGIQLETVIGAPAPDDAVTGEIHFGRFLSEMWEG